MYVKTNDLEREIMKMANNDSWWKEREPRYSKDSWWKEQCTQCSGTGETKHDMNFRNDNKCSRCRGEGFI